jgi:2,3-bisphosphoglycerate-independent phosphoglycerate mutase
LAQYDPELPAQAAFVESGCEYPLARIISEVGLTQLHMAETEKYAHVTYYLNVGQEKSFRGEKRVLIKSSSVKNFAKRPKMEAERITARLQKEVEAAKYDVYFVNYANADMVGHTGDFKAAIKACECIDDCVKKVCESVISVGGAVLITADHGNAENMLDDETGESLTEHSTSPVPFYYIREELKRAVPKSDQEVTQIFSSPVGILTDVAPTILDVLRLPRGPEMTGVSLLGSLR